MLFQYISSINNNKNNINTLLFNNERATESEQLSVAIKIENNEKNINTAMESDSLLKNNVLLIEQNNTKLNLNKELDDLFSDVIK